jgi:hypothetical protein
MLDEKVIENTNRKGSIEREMGVLIVLTIEKIKYLTGTKEDLPPPWVYTDQEMLLKI